jgi:predicted RND superfamily exporter protein
MKNLKIGNRNWDESLLGYLAIAFIVIFSGFFVFKIYRTYNNSELVNYDTELTGKIQKFEDYKGQVYILFENENKYWSIDNSYNYDYSSAFLGDFLADSDYVYKNACSDTLFIQRDNVEYFFIIGDNTFNSNEISDIVKERYKNSRRIIQEKGNCMETKNFKLKAEEIEELIANSGWLFCI